MNTEWNITIPGGFVAMPSVVVGGGSPFVARSPKPDAIQAVKLTQGNIKAVAGHVIAALGDDVEVKLEGDRITAREGDWLSFSAKVGQWLIEDYNYSAHAPHRAIFRAARSDEREKYDLR